MYSGCSILYGVLCLIWGVVLYIVCSMVILCVVCYMGCNSLFVVSYVIWVCSFMCGVVLYTGFSIVYGVSYLIWGAMLHMVFSIVILGLVFLYGV